MSAAPHEKGQNPAMGEIRWLRLVSWSPISQVGGHSECTFRPPRAP